MTNSNTDTIVNRLSSIRNRGFIFILLLSVFLFFEWFFWGRNTVDIHIRDTFYVISGPLVYFFLLYCTCLIIGMLAKHINRKHSDFYRMMITIGLLGLLSIGLYIGSTIVYWYFYPPQMLKQFSALSFFRMESLMFPVLLNSPCDGED